MMRIRAVLGFVALLLAGSPAAATQVAVLDGDKSPKGGSQAQAQADVVIAHVRKKEYEQALQVATRLTLAYPNEPIGYTMQGVVHLSMQERAKARASFERALGVEPQYRPALLNLAELDLRETKLADARRNFQKILETDPRNAAAMIGMAKVESADQNEQASLAWAQRAKAANPGATAAPLLLASHYLATGKYDLALAELTGAQRDHPNDAELLSTLGRVQAAAGKKSEAVSTYKKLVALRPQAPEAYRGLAMAQLAVDDVSGAKASLQKALELKPDYVEGLSALAAANARAGRYADALALARKVQTLAPGQSIGFALEGDILVEQQQFSQALPAYEKALALNQTGQLAIKRHTAQSRAGGLAAANVNLRKWSAEHPDDTVASLYVAQELVKSGQDKEAIEQYQKVLKKDPRNSLALNNLANMYAREKDPRAMATAEEAYKADADSPAAADTLGWILVEQGQVARGLELLTKATAKAPENIEIRFHFAAALIKAGDKVKARKELEDLLAGSRRFPQRAAAQALLEQL